MGCFKMAMYVGIAFRVDSSFKLTILAFVFTFTNWDFGA
jgi:hypothetical protein